ncbi:molybdenum cofactor guanylyltransferase MobA [Psychromarinibacter sp. C21-152]|uniref:Molybdenum cofactor guanylyltransferase n=1 Tax=Psychromarinibacter sediminicola TaxID=3033385 RepID=A0AAE3NWS5_9RHOB|nr:molybdenum cofactor guanylyltransferase MobA [Psychromarinibacter sediminicola]MDF0602385.1 molybdenum cofactor guanylyltransferase MobA [Psychromarinibacter sediminicola]
MGEIPGIVLAGGLSRRMGGGDKTLLPLAGKPVLSHVIGRLAPQVSQVVLNANGDAARFAPFGLPVLPDPTPDHFGPLAGVLAGLDWAAGEGLAEIVTVAADTPFLPPDLVEKLRYASERHEKPIAIAVTPDGAGGYRRHPVFGLWPVFLRGDLREALQDGARKVMDWVALYGAAEATFLADPVDPFFNINTSEDLQQAEEIVQARA